MYRSARLRHTDNPLQVATDIAEEIISGQSALKLALLVNELLMNSLKHAKQVERPLVVSIKLECSELSHKLTVSDNGDGLPENFDPENGSGIGMRILKTLTSDLGARMNIDRNKTGACFEIDLPERL